jgi:hypothetical protein
VAAAAFAVGLVLGLALDRWPDGTDGPVPVAGEAAPEAPRREAARAPSPPPAPRAEAPPAPAAPDERVAALVPEPAPKVIPAPAPAPEPSPALAPAPSGAPDWQRFAAAAPAPREGPLIAVLIDDLGHNARRVARVIALEAPLTLAFLPYGQALPALTAEARRAGHEVLVHLPMEPEDPSQDPGPGALLTGLDGGEILTRLRWQLGRFEGYVGVNNHMGSRFTRDRAGMTAVMAEVKARGLLYVDSRTTPQTLGSALAHQMGVPEIARDVFLDDEQSGEGVRRQLALLEDTARRQGFAVAIGHPHAVTLEALEAWLPGIAGRGFVLAPVSAVIRRQLSVPSRRAGPSPDQRGAQAFDRRDDRAFDRR